jgi:hypothetical protein
MLSYVDCEKLLLLLFVLRVPAAKKEREGGGGGGGSRGNCKRPPARRAPPPPPPHGDSFCVALPSSAAANVLTLATRCHIYTPHMAHTITPPTFAKSHQVLFSTCALLIGSGGL